MTADTLQTPAQARTAQILDVLEETGHRAFVGVPCSLLAPIYDGVARRGTDVFAATREDLAIGVATGLALAGQRSVVLMQNSGLGGSVGALLSLPHMYGLGMILLISWRGHGPDAPEHVELGAKMEQLLELAGLPWAAASAPRDELLSLVTAGRPVAIVVRPRELA
jgi:phosphonopyruvate decarboxylase